MSLSSHCRPIDFLRVILVLCIGAVAAGGSALAETYAIPADQLDRKLVYYGAPSSFEKPAEVDYERVVRATPEYQEIQTENIERGTGRYWILLSRASDRVGRLVSSVGNDQAFDLICASGYLGSLEPAIPAEDITEVVLAALETSVK